MPKHSATESLYFSFFLVLTANKEGSLIWLELFSRALEEMRTNKARSWRACYVLLRSLDFIQKG
jgi:hypothetical protein